MNGYRHAKKFPSLDPNLQQAYLQESQTALSLVKKAAVETSANGWELVSESPKQMARLERNAREQVPTYRVVGELYNTTVDQVFELLWNLNNSIKLSGSLEENDLLFETSEVSASSELEILQLLYHGHKSPGLMISQRDYFIARSCKTEDGGATKLLINRSVTHPNVPDRSRFVRGVLHYSGYILRTSATKPNTVEVLYVIQSDPKGSLPTWVVNMANKTLVDKFVELQAHVDNMNR